VNLLDRYPSIVSVDETEDMEQEKWTKGHYFRLLLFLALSTLVLPVIVCMVGFVLPVSAFYKHIKDHHIVSDKKWILNAYKHHLSNSPSTSSFLNLSLNNAARTRSQMIDNLNLHEWRKIHVYFPMTNAHSAIINRKRIGRSAIEENHDVIKYFVDEVFMFVEEEEEGLTNKERWK
jgi:hypothetical protein